MTEVTKLKVQRFRKPKKKALWTLVEVHFDDDSTYLIRVERRPNDRHLWVPKHPFGKVSVKSALWRQIVRELNRAHEAYMKGFNLPRESRIEQTPAKHTSTGLQQELFQR